MREILPSKWCIKRTTSNAKIINAWANEQEGPQIYYNSDEGYITNEVGFQNKSWSAKPPDIFVEITFEAFERLVLKKTTSEDFSKLKKSPFKYKEGDRVIFRGEHTVISKLHQPAHLSYIIEYSLGWLGNSEDNLSSSKRYCYAIERDLKPDFYNSDCSSVETPLPEPDPQPIPYFKVGDSVTYKDKRNCVHRHGRTSSYWHSGIDHGGYTGRIIDVLEYNDKMHCFELKVTSKESIDYTMLECEFKEYRSSYNKTSSSSDDNFRNPCLELVSVDKDKKSSKLETVPHQKEFVLSEIKTINRLVTI